jgi:TolA-binding protein
MPAPRDLDRPLVIGLIAAGLVFHGSTGAALRAQAPAGKASTFTTVRTVQVPSMPSPAEVVVAEFYTHGELRPDGSNLAVTTSAGQPVPWRVFQVGPGDFCRVAFQTAPKQTAYRIRYGGDGPRPTSPAWTAASGLVLETRRWKSCNLHNLASVRAAFAAAAPLGSDYVGGVFHGYNPFWPEAEPFLSVYRGKLVVGTAGKYRFFTSSQDCSFLLIDGRQVVSAPGAHGPVHQARISGEATLSAGAHDFEYVHAASGGSACMVAAWQPPGAAKPEIIPASAFRASRVVHVAPGRPQHAQKGTLPDFTAAVVGEAPLEDVEVLLVRVQFRQTRPAASGAKARWEFGDGQTSTDPDPVHVYLRPGLFSVRLGSPGQEVVNRVHVPRGAALPPAKGRADTLADYAPMLNRYDAHKLDPLSALQLIRFCEQSRQHNRAAQIGKVWLLSKQPPEDEGVVRAMAELVGPLLRDRLNESADAAGVWQAAAGVVRAGSGKAACEVEAADILLNDLHKPAEARPLLEAASAHLAGADGAPAARLQRVWGDWYARGGDRKPALAAYRKAQALAPKRSAAEREARRGAYSRSTEAFLRDKALDRARDELRRWQDEFPEDRVQGYLPLLQARYLFAAEKFRHAVVVAGDLRTVNPESAYADQLLFLAGECEEKLARPARARAAYQALLADYPGSPLVRAARQKLARLPATDPKE